MSLNNIVLSDLIVTEWYGDGMLIPSGRSVPQPPSSVTPPAQPVQTLPATPVPQTPAAPIPATPIPATPKPQPSADSSPAAYKFLGSHHRKVTIIVDSPGSAFLPDEQLGFLTKILEACRMNIGDVAIVNHHTAPVAIATLRQQLQPEFILLFGVSPTAVRLPINFAEFRPQPYDQCTYLLTPPL